VELTARRVEADAVEDLVQDALRIVHDRGGVAPGTLVDDRPALAWCFQVLRNVIGNHYQRRGARDQIPLEDAELVVEGPTPLDRLASADRRRLLREAVAELAGRPDHCAEYLESVLSGADPAQIAERAGIAPAVLYRRLYRCRERLREILERRGVRP
jgi:RNA polymerase sigma factor (sigma-70 family)